MKFIIVFVAIFAVAFAYPGAEVEIVRSESDVQANSYKFGFETSDGTKHDASAVLEDEGSDHEDLEVQGSYSFIADDGKLYTTTYTAGKDGFVAQGDHLPVAPQN